MAISDFCLKQGQTESKKISKRGSTAPETKGTAMSFGFKKKLLPSNKKNVVNMGAKEKEAENTEQYGKIAAGAACATVYSNPNCIEMEMDNGDANGNTGKEKLNNQRNILSEYNPKQFITMHSLSKCFAGYLEERDTNTTTGRSTPTVVAPKKESSGVPYRSTRFGFRKGNIVRPASTGLPLKVTNFDNVANNNNISNGSGIFKTRCLCTHFDH